MAVIANWLVFWLTGLGMCGNMGFEVAEYGLKIAAKAGLEAGYPGVIRAVNWDFAG